MRIAILGFLLLTACGGGGGEPTVLNSEITGFLSIEQPDVVLLTVSGRTLDLADLFCPPECNRPYLGEEGNAGETIFSMMAAEGLSIEVRHYIASLRSFDDDGDEQPDRFGILQLIRDLEWVRDNWAGTRVLLVGHSHGCVWVHNVIAARPDLQIDFLVSLDGVSLQWESDHREAIDDYYAEQGGNPFAIDIRDVTDVWTVPGGERDTKDIVFDNVGFDIEVRSADFLLSDEIDNARLDGTTTGITTLAATGDTHTGMLAADTESMRFVVDQLRVALLASAP